MNTILRSNEIGYVGGSMLSNNNVTVNVYGNDAPANLFDMLRDHINVNAAYDSLERENEGVSTCMDETRTDVLREIEDWAQSKDGRPVCWLYGPTDSGKSTIAHTIAEEFDKDKPGKKLAFSFFFSLRHPDRSDMTKFFPTFAFQLAYFIPSTQQLIHAALRNRAILTKRRRDQFANLIVRPVQSITQPASPMIIVIDGLDEYDEVGGAFPLEDLIQLLLGDLPKIPFRFLFTSRPEARIEAIFSIPWISSSTHRIALQGFPNDEPDTRREVKPYTSLGSTWMPLRGCFSVATNLASVSCAPGCLDLFICGNDGRVYNSWRRKGRGWNGWRSLGGSFTPGATISAIARKQNQIDLFICGNDGCIYTSWWYKGGGWSGAKGDWKSLGGFFSAATSLTSLSRAPEYLDLFICGNDGHVYNSWWREGHGWHGWRPLGGFFMPGARISAIAHKQNQMDLFICGKDGCIYTSWWSKGVGWSSTKNDWKSLGGFFSAATSLTSLSRAPESIDLFVSGNDRHVYNLGWKNNHGWSSWRSVGGLLQL